MQGGSYSKDDATRTGSRGRAAVVLRCGQSDIPTQKSGLQLPALIRHYPNTHSLTERSTSARPRQLVDNSDGSTGRTTNPAFPHSRVPIMFMKDAAYAFPASRALVWTAIVQTVLGCCPVRAMILPAIRSAAILSSISALDHIDDDSGLT
jgi:hypothetical protein